MIQENGQVSYETSAGRLSLPASIVDHSCARRRAAGFHSRNRRGPRRQPAHRASERARPRHTTKPCSAAVRDGSIDLDLLAKLESEANANPTPTAVARVVAAESAAAQFEISVGDFEQAAGALRRRASL